MVSNICKQRIQDTFSILFSCKIEIQRNDSTCLCFTYNTSCLCIIFSLECIQSCFIKIRILFRFFVFSQHLCCLLHKICYIQIVSICNHIFVCRSGSVRTLFFVQCKPVSVLESTLPETVLSTVILDIIYPFMHTVPVFFQNTFVSVNLINNPRNNNCYITPCGGTVRSQNIRHYMRNTLFKGRLCCHITHPFFVK